MNQIVDTLSQTSNWSSALPNTKKNQDGSQNRFEDILNGRKGQTSMGKAKESDQQEQTTVDEKAMYQQVQMVFPWMQMQETVQQNITEVNPLQAQDKLLSVQETDMKNASTLIPVQKETGKEDGIFSDKNQTPLSQSTKEGNDNQLAAKENHLLQTSEESNSAYIGKTESGVVLENSENNDLVDAKETRGTLENSTQGLSFAAGMENIQGNEQKVTNSQDIQSSQEDVIRPDMQELKDSIAKQISDGKTEFQVQLKPANLGTLVVNASYENGKTIISISCVEPKTMHVMMQNAAELGSLVQSRLGSPTEVVVEAPHADYLEQNNEQQKSQQQGNSHQHESRKEEVHEEAELFIQQLRLGLV